MPERETRQKNFLKKMFPPSPDTGSTKPERLKRISRRRKGTLADLDRKVFQLGQGFRGLSLATLDYRYNEYFPRIRYFTQLRIASGKDPNAEEEAYWREHHSKTQLDIILEAWGVKDKIDKEGFTPENKTLLNKKIKNLPKNWMRYGVEPGSDSWAAIKRNEMAFQKWQAANREKKKTLTGAV